jgi:phage terminase large subunit-like protein
MMDSQNLLAIWRTDPIAFINDFCRDPETGKPFVLYPAQETFLREALTLTPDGRLPYSELIYSCPKKSGKTMMAAWITLYMMIVLGGAYAETIICANDFEQASSRVFHAVSRLLDPRRTRQLKLAKITANQILFPSTGGTITAISSDYASSAGANPNLVVFDELWGYSSERSRRLFDELVPPPTRKIATRLTVTYAGYEGESELLESLYKRGVQGEEIAPALYRQPGMLMFWSHEPVAPWQSEQWLLAMRSQLRPNAYLRLIENRWVSSESNYVDMADFDQCVDPEARPVLNDPHLPVFIGLDGSYQHDSTAISVVCFDHKQQKVRMVAHKVFTPTKDQPVDFAAVEAELLDMRRRFAVQAIFFDPYQLIALSQRMEILGLPMEPFTQTSSNLEAAATNLAELIRHHNLVAYHDPEIRLALSRTVSVETPRGVRISKQKGSHRIDIIAALSFACFAAVRGGQQAVGADIAFQQRAAATFHALALARHGGQPRRGSQAELDAIEDAQNARRPMLIRSHRWGGRGGY